MQTPQEHRRRYGTLDRAAKYADTSVWTIRRLISDGTLTGFRFGKRSIRVDLDELDAAMRPIPSAREAS